MTTNKDGWIGAVNLAGSEAEIVRLADEFMKTWSREQLAALPGDCQVRTLANLEAVSDLAFSLVRHECALEPVNHPAILQAMAQFFAAASTRGAALRARSRGLRLMGIPTIATSAKG